MKYKFKDDVDNFKEVEASNITEAKKKIRKHLNSLNETIGNIVLFETKKKTIGITEIQHSLKCQYTIPFNNYKMEYSKRWEIL